MKHIPFIISARLRHINGGLVSGESTYIYHHLAGNAKFVTYLKVPVKSYSN